MCGLRDGAHRDQRGDRAGSRLVFGVCARAARDRRAWRAGCRAVDLLIRSRRDSSAGVNPRAWCTVRKSRTWTVRAIVGLRIFRTDARLERGPEMTKLSRCSGRAERLAQFGIADLRAPRAGPRSALQSHPPPYPRRARVPSSFGWRALRPRQWRGRTFGRTWVGQPWAVRSVQLRRSSAQRRKLLPLAPALRGGAASVPEPARAVKY